jgi:hypothetical protein
LQAVTTTLQETTRQFVQAYQNRVLPQFPEMPAGQNVQGFIKLIQKQAQLRSRSERLSMAKRKPPGSCIGDFIPLSGRNFSPS